jgi:Putative mono-oxygenase ydhR
VPVVRIALWSLADTATSVAELREYVRDEAVPAFERVSGLLFKAWVSDEATERWGAVYLFDSAAAAEQPLPSRARELIGKEPEIVEVFDLEASIAIAPQLARLGVAFDDA